MIVTLNHRRNGTSQDERQLDALDPTYFLLEERSIADLIRYGKKYTNLLKYYNQNNIKDGNWSAFLDADPEELAVFLEDPNHFDVFPDKKAKFSKPHLVLFLIFLKFLQKSHSLINGLSKKQLDFYYREALGFVTQPPVPDQVHILAKLDEERTNLLIPKGTLLEAGDDGNGNPVHYMTDDDLVANQAQIARLMSLFVEKELTGIPLLRFQGKKMKDGGFLSILNIIYRKKGTVNSPRNFPHNLEGDLLFDQTIIDKLDQLENKIINEFRLRIAAFQQLMQHYHNWYDDQENNSWSKINGFLLITFNNRTNRNVNLNTFVDKDPRDFDRNFEKALGFSTIGIRTGNNNINVFDGIPDVNNLYDLFARYSSSPKDSKIITFITDHFKQVDFNKFKGFIEIRKRSLGFMTKVHQLLKAAAPKHNFIPKNWSPTNYDSNKTLTNAFAKLLGVTNISADSIFIEKETELSNLEAYFKMKVEDYFFIRNLFPDKKQKVPNWKWKRADLLLTQAYQICQRDDAVQELTTKKISPDAPIDLAKIPQIDRSLKPEIIRWKNLYQANDTTLLLETALTKKESHSRWKLFGSIPSKTMDPELHFESEVGWGITTPSLVLSGGNRELTVHFIFKKEEFIAQRPILIKYFNNWNTEKGPSPFRIEISTAKKWVLLEKWLSFEIKKNKPEIVFKVLAGEDVDPFAPLAAEPNASPWPCLRLLLPKTDFYLKDKQQPKQVYELFRAQILHSVELSIQVTALKDLQIETKQNLIDTKKPFEPFGSRPETGDRLYITHPELAAQKLITLDINFEWKNLPADDLEAYVGDYNTLGKALEVLKEDKLKKENFKVNLTLVESYHRMKLLEAHYLFQKNDEKDNVLTASAIPDSFSNSGFAYRPKANAESAENVINSDRYLELELQTQDFFHDLYYELLERKGLAITNTIATTPIDKSALEKVNLFLPEPFTPILKSVSVNYSTSVKIDWTEGISDECMAIHIEPFGTVPLEVNGSTVRFLPEFEAEGTLYIGLQNLEPPNTISFLFQLAEGSANPDLNPSPIRWSYLSENVWIPFAKEELLLDTTQGLLSSGIIQIYIPEKASKHHQRMPEGLYWISIQVDQFSGSLSDCIDIRTQAVSATWIDSGIATDHLLTPLNPDSIRQTVEPLSGIAALKQPYSSFFGKMAEVDEQLYRRTSGRIRHKNRALTLWDYENLVLEAFPDIYKVKAIASDHWGDDYKAGSVRIVVIPDIHKRKPFDPFEPKVPVNRLSEIQKFLQERAPVFASIQVQNPRFLFLQLLVKARFHDMNNFGYYAGQLHQELLEYLAPWAFEKSKDIVFSGKIYPSIIVDFIESRPYVDYIDKPRIELMKRDPDGRISVVPNPSRDKDGLLYIKEPDVVVVSAHQHFIEYLALPEENLKQVKQGIGFAKIEFDFRISSLD